MLVDVEDLELGLPESLDSNGIILTSLKNMYQSIQGREKSDILSVEESTENNKGIKISSCRKNCQSLLFHFAEMRGHPVTQLSSNAKEFDADFESLEKFCLPLIIVMFERLKFYGRARKEGEKIEDYFKVLDILSEACEFGPDRDYKVKQHFVKSGDINSSLKKLIQESSPLSLKSIFDAFLLPRHGSKCLPFRNISQRMLSSKESKGTEIAKHSTSPSPKYQKLGTCDNTASSEKMRKTCDNKSPMQHIKTGFMSAVQNEKGNKVLQTCGQETEIIFHDFENNSVYNTCSKSKSKSSWEAKMNYSCGSKEDEDDVVNHFNCNNVGRERDMDIMSDVTSNKNPSCKSSHINIYAEEEENRAENTCFAPLAEESKIDGEERGKKKLFTCQACKLIFSEHQIYKDHIKIHICTCEICGTKFAYPSLLERHMTKHTGIKHVKKKLPSISAKQMKKKMICSVCCITFRTAVSFNNHMITYCDVCETDSNVSNPECNHELSVKCPGSKKLKRHHCDLCGAAFCGIYELYKHNKMHTISPNFKCSVCSQTFADELALNNHSSAHLDLKVPAQSKDMYSKISNASQSIKPQGSLPKKPHECSVCGEKFFKRFYLKNHMRSHSGETPYTCDLCGACFKAQWNLSRHYLVHTGARPHTCQICNKSFKWQSTFTSHMKLHQGKKPTQLFSQQKIPQGSKQESLHQAPLIIEPTHTSHASNMDLEGHHSQLIQSQNQNLQNHFHAQEPAEQPLQQQLQPLPPSSYLDQSRMTGHPHPGVWSPLLGGIQTQRPDWAGWL